MTALVLKDTKMMNEHVIQNTSRMTGSLVYSETVYSIVGFLAFLPTQQPCSVALVKMMAMQFFFPLFFPIEETERNR